MEEKKPVSHIKAGLLIALFVLVASMIIGVATGGGIGPSGGWIGFLLMIVGLLYFINLFAKANDYQLTFGELFSYGFKATTMIVLINVIYLVVIAMFIPELKQQSMEATRQEYIQRKGANDKEMEAALQFVDKYFWTMLIGTSVFLFAFIGAIGSLIGAAITKKQPKNPFGQTSF